MTTISALLSEAREITRALSLCKYLICLSNIKAFNTRIYSTRHQALAEHLQVYVPGSLFFILQVSIHLQLLVISFLLYIGAGKTFGILTRLRIGKYRVWIPEETGIFSPLPNIPTRRSGPPRLPFHGECGSFPRVKPRLKNSSYTRVSPVSLYVFTAKREKMSFVFLFNAALSTLIDREIVVELRRKSSKILLMNSGGGGGHDIFFIGNISTFVSGRSKLVRSRMAGFS